MFRLILLRVGEQVCEVVKVQSRGFSDPLVIVFSCLLYLSSFLNFKITLCTKAHISPHARTDAHALIKYALTKKYTVYIFYMQQQKQYAGSVNVWVGPCVTKVCLVKCFRTLWGFLNSCDFCKRFIRWRNPTDDLSSYKWYEFKSYLWWQEQIFYFLIYPCMSLYWLAIFYSLDIVFLVSITVFLVHVVSLVAEFRVFIPKDNWRHGVLSSVFWQQWWCCHIKG